MADQFNAPLELAVETAEENFARRRLESAVWFAWGEADEGGTNPIDATQLFVAALNRLGYVIVRKS